LWWIFFKSTVIANFTNRIHYYKFFSACYTLSLQKLFIYKWKFVHFDQHFSISHNLSTHGNYPFILFLWVQLFYIPHTSGIIQSLSFSLLLISPTVMSSRFINIIWNGRISLYKRLMILYMSVCTSTQFLYPFIYLKLFAYLAFVLFYLGYFAYYCLLWKTFFQSKECLFTSLKVFFEAWEVLVLKKFNMSTLSLFLCIWCHI
jgi:hypothetical protein